jgi:hypothetical protein
MLTRSEFLSRGGRIMKDDLAEYSSKYINETTTKKEGYCQRCLSEGQPDRLKKKTLYTYYLPKQQEPVFVCERHIGFLELAKEAVLLKKPMNDLEKMRAKKELNRLSIEGRKLLK